MIRPRSQSQVRSLCSLPYVKSGRRMSCSKASSLPAGLVIRLACYFGCAGELTPRQVHSHWVGMHSTCCARTEWQGDPMGRNWRAKMRTCLSTEGQVHTGGDQWRPLADHGSSSRGGPQGASRSPLPTIKALVQKGRLTRTIELRKPSFEQRFGGGPPR